MIVQTASERNSLDLLAMRAKEGEMRAKEELANTMYSQADRIAKTFAFKMSSGESFFSDYRSEAMIGMLECLSSYDSSKGHFDSYSAYAMRQKIRDFINFDQRIISQPKNVTEKIAKLNKLLSTDSEITDDELLDATGFSEKVLRSAQAARVREYVYSLDMPCDWEGEETTIMNYIESGENPEKDVLTKMEQNRVMKELGLLSKRERYLLFSSFGAWGYPKRSAKELAIDFGVSVTSIYNYKREISERLRKRLLVS